MTSIERRVFARYDAPRSWSARYLFDDCPEPGWRDCQVLDISKGGAALELQPDEHMDGLLALELYAFGDVPRDIALRGEIRHASRLPTGALRVGVEFVAETTYEVQLIDLLLSMIEIG